MKKLLITLIIAIIIPLSACGSKPELTQKEQAIVILALEDMDEEIDGDKINDTTLELIYLNDDVPWLDCNIGHYILTMEGRKFRVDTHEKDDTIYDVDVIEEIKHA